MSRVFISYPSEYAEQAGRLVVGLRAYGHDVWWDVEKINIGDSVVAALDTALAESSYLVLCIGQSDRSTPWRDVEWMSTLARQVSGAQIKILPALITRRPRTPAILSDLAYADLAADWDEGVRRLDKAMRIA